MRVHPAVPAALLAALLPMAASAELTLGGNIGSARVDEGTFEGSDAAWKAHLGGSFRQIIGAELGFTNFGSLGGDGPEAQAWTPALLVGVPIGMARLYAKGGMAFQEVEGTAAREEFEDENPFYGVGLRVGRESGLGFRLEYERYRFDDLEGIGGGDRDVDLAQAGLEFRFGQRDGGA